MGRKKVKEAEKTNQERLEDLSQLWGKLNLPDDAFNGDLRDAADEEADLIYENIKESVALEKLEFLYIHGWEIGRLEQMVREWKKEED